MKKIIIIGGGAGGLGLATQLGNKLGKNKQAEVILVDKNLTHLWKPLLHEVATGVLDDDLDDVSYLAQGHNNNFIFKQGELIAINRDNKTVTISEVCNDNDVVVSPQKTLQYDVLVLAIGSISNDFAIPGVKENCIFLDDQAAANRLRKTILTTFFRFSSGIDEHHKDKIRIAIVGAGATGVELTAELFNMVETLQSYQYDKLPTNILDVVLIEAGARILPALPEKISANIQAKLEHMGARVLLDTSIVKADKDSLYPAIGEPILADIMVWVAGVKAPDFLKDIAGLESSRSNQFIVKPTLQTSRDDSIFALGDCASYANSEGNHTPATAQAAHQMASICGANVIAYINNKPLKQFIYKDKGTIISLGHTAQGVVTTIGSSQVGVKGCLAHSMYKMLYRMHQSTLFGPMKTYQLAKSNKIYRSIRPSLKID